MTKIFNRKFAAVLLSVAMAAALFAGFGTPAWAAGDPSVTVSVTYGNFSLDGVYTGNGFTNLNFNIEDLELTIDEIQYWIDDANLKANCYLPSDVTDPLGGGASIIDAILTAFYYYGFIDVTEPGDPNLSAGWDANPEDGEPGAYIYNIAPQTITTNPPETVYIDDEPYTKYSGNGWQVAYTQNNSLEAAEAYTSNIPLTDGMVIVFDISDYEILEAQ